MFSTLRNAWKVPDIRKKILYTLMMLFVYRIGAHVPVPGMDVAQLSEAVSGGNNLLAGFMDLFAGGALSRFSLFALGITPYITASIIMNLLTMALPPLERMSKEGPEGRKKIASITRYAAVGLGLVQAVAILLSFQDFILDMGGIPVALTYITMILCLTAGTALIMWIGEHITENGVGNGISLIIFISIVSRLGPEAIKLVQNGFDVNVTNTSIITIFVVLIAAVAIIVGITFVDLGERRIPVQYAKRVVGRKMYGGQSTHIPMKINQSGVLPLIFALTLVQFPTIIMQLTGADPEGYKAVMGPDKILYLAVFALLIFFFTFFYSQATFNPPDVAKNMQQNGGFIPGIRAGKPTSDYLAKILVRITLFGALFLALVATIPTGLAAIAGFDSAFGPTSLLIMVSVSLETTRQLESQMMMRHYKGFLK
ncbi:MAG: preprotein translocase subunit SecY [Clostridia bacterium]|jgi:preprotein translocase subunit SecY|nr:preprotein translocase subunit SecY [Clostridia bacterium]MBT7122371.1 preprotein translocase subunit SecY [Clostridia bacterium]